MYKSNCDNCDLYIYSDLKRDGLMIHVFALVFATRLQSVTVTFMSVI